MAVAANVNATITASLNGQSVHAALTVTPPPLALKDITVTPSSVLGTQSATATVDLTGPAPAGGASVALSNSDPSAQIPASVAIAAGQASASVTVTTSSVSSIVTATLTAAAFGGTQSTTLTINPYTVTSIGLNPTSVIGTNPSTATVTINAAAPVGGLTINLSSSSGAAQTPATVFIPGGQTSATFTVSTIGVATVQIAGITASLNGTSKTGALTINPPSCAVSALTSLTLGSTVAPLTTVTGTVTLASPAVAGGESVSLSSSSPTFLNVPASVLVPANSTTANFTATAGAPAQLVNVTVTATYHQTSLTASIAVSALSGSNSNSGPSTGNGGSTTPPYVTVTGAQLGFSLSTFCPSISTPSGIAVAPNGNVIITTGYADGAQSTGTAYVFSSDTDNQTISQAKSYASSVVGLAVSNGVIYGTIPASYNPITGQPGTGSIVVVDPNTGQPTATLVSNVDVAAGIVTNPTNGHLIVSGVNILDVDPSLSYAIAQPKTIVANANVNTVAISSDGQTVFGNGYSTYAWNINTGTGLTGFPIPYGSPDGDLDGGSLAAGGGSLSTDLFLNYASYNSTAQFYEFDLTHPTATPFPILEVPGGGDDDSTYAVYRS